MTSVGAFSNELRNLGVSRIRNLCARGIVNNLYVHLHPVDDATQRNLLVLDEYKAALGSSLWGWTVGSGDAAADAAGLLSVDKAHDLGGYMLNFEKPWQEKSLKPFYDALALVGFSKPLIFSLAATGPSYANYDYREIDKHGHPISWQCYMDSGEGQAPNAVVNEAFKTPFVIDGWQYRHHIRPIGTPANKARYGWGTVHSFTATTAKFNSALRAGADDATFKVGDRAWGKAVVDHTLRRNGQVVGQLLGRIAYNRIRATLDVTRGYDTKHTLAEWSAIAASARVQGLAKRPIDVYMVENCADDVMEAIAKGAT